MSVLNAAHFRDEEAAFAKLESIVWPDGPVCPIAARWIASIPSRACAPSPARSTPKASSARPQEVRPLPQAVHGPRRHRVRGQPHPAAQVVSGGRTCCAHPRRASAATSSTASWRSPTRRRGSLSHRLREAMRVGGLMPRWAAVAASSRSTRRSTAAPQRTPRVAGRRPQASPTRPTRTSSCRLSSAAAAFAATTSRAAP